MYDHTVQHNGRKRAKNAKNTVRNDTLSMFSSLHIYNKNFTKSSANSYLFLHAD